MKKFHPVITNFLFNIPSYSSLNRVWIFSTPNQACFLIKKLKNLHSIYIQNCMPHFTIFQVWMFLYSCSNTSSVIRQKVESQNGGDKKTKHTKYLKKQTHLTPWYAHIPVGKKCFFSENFVCFVFLWPVSRSSLCRTTNSLHYRIWSDYKKEANSVIFKVSHTL